MLSRKTNQLFTNAHNYATTNNHEYVTTEHVLLFLIEDPIVNNVLKTLEVDTNSLKSDLINYLEENMPLSENKPEIATDIQILLNKAALDAKQAQKNEVEPYHLLMAIYRALDVDHFSRYILEAKYQVKKLDVAQILSHGGVVSSEAMAQQGEDPNEPMTKDKLPSYITNLNIKAQSNRIDPLIGREDEVERVIHTLVRRRKNNPLLVGEPGVGKTAIAEGLALKIVRGEVPSKLKDCTIYSVDLGGMLAGTKYRGDFEERMNKLLALMDKEPTAILFFDEIHTIVGAGAAGSGSMDASNMLKPKLANGLKVIGATTYKEYRNGFEKDSALARRFQKIDVVEPSVSDTIRILTGVKTEFEKFHNVTYTPEAIKSAVELSVKHINDRFLPDKAIDLLDEAGATLSLTDTKGQVDQALIEKMISKIARIPEKTVSTSQKDKLKNLEKEIKTVLYGQDEAVRVSVEAIELAKSGLRKGNKPIASMLFCGPTGVGKTELVKQLADNLGIQLLRFDMSEYGEKHTVSRLIGSPPGYTGHEEEGQLTGSVMKHPHSIILLDEIEKAHPDIFNILLQVMDYGTLTDSKGRKADFKNCIVVMTSNTGAAEASKPTLGIQTNAKEFNYEKPVQAVGRTFSPEFRNRLDAVVYFNPLTKENIISVLDKYILELDNMLMEKNVSIEFSPEAKDFIISKGYDPKMGARPMQRVLEDKVSRKLAKEILYGKLENGGEVSVIIENNDIAFSIKGKKAKKAKKEQSV